MATELILPRVDMDMIEGKIAHWYVKNGDTVTKGQVVFEIETDKATMEVEAPVDGTVQGIDGQIDVTMPVGQIVGWILEAGEGVPDRSGSVQSGSESHVTPKPKGERINAPDALRNAPAEALPAPPMPHAEPLRATPLARSIARERGLDLHSVVGSGPGGRVVRSDLPEFPADTGASASVMETRLHLHWFSERADAPVVMLHGFGTSLGSWRPLTLQLENLPLVGIDLPNHGKSPRVATPDLTSMAASVLGRLDEEGIRSLHLVGHSMGAGTALALTAMLGSRLKSLTLLAPLSMGPEINGSFVQGLIRAGREESLRPWLTQLFGDASRLSASFVATAWRELQSPERRAALAEVADRLLPDGTQATIQRELLDGLSVPTKVIWGTLDRIVPYHQSAGLSAQAALHSMVGIGHLPHVEAVNTVAALVRQQVAAAAASATRIAG